MQHNVKKFRNAMQQSTAEQLIKCIKSLLGLPLPPYVLLTAICELLEHGPAVLQKLMK
jgi:hypothetical protein